MKVEFFKHSVGDEELKLIQETFATPFLTTGPKTAQFEREFAQYLGAEYCLGVTSCTAGLFLALKALGIGPGDEVIVPAMTFIATSNVVLHCGAKPVFVDVSPETGLLDVNQVKQAIGPRTKAIIPVHLYGQMVDMKSLRQVADEGHLALIEDCAHAVESERDGLKPGQLSEAAVFSFYATKNITSGEGGAVVTNDGSLYEKLKPLRLHGMSKSAAERYHNKYQHWDMIELGYKYNMSDVQAAMLIPQLRHLDSRLQRREEIAKVYEKEFEGAQIEFPKIQNGAKSARHLFTIWVDPEKRDQVLSELQKAQIGVAVNYRSVHLLSYYRENFGFKRGDLPVSERIGDRTISLPLYPALKDEEVEYVCNQVIRIVNNLEQT